MIDLSTMTLTVSGSQLTVNTSVNPMKLSTNGAVQRPGQTMFVAVDNGSGWIYFAGDGWTKIPFNNLGSSPNVGSCFNLGTSRFTAPVTGLYWFTASTYLYKDTGSAGYYMHPMFWVNGGGGTATAFGYPYYRIRGHGMPPANQELDGQIDRIIRLAANDYVEFYHYSIAGGLSGAGGNRYYNYYSRFAGGLIS